MTLDPVALKMAVWFGLGKGVLIAGVLAAVDVSFVNSLIVAAVSGAIGAGGVVLAALITAREARKTRAVVHDVKRKLNAANRETD